MRRRDLIAGMAGGAALAFFGQTGSVSAAASGQSTMRPLPRRELVRVAFMLGDGANVIDTAGPWEVFQDVMVGDHHHPFQLYTVAAAGDEVRMTGGLRVRPHHRFADAPQPHVIVVPAQRSSTEGLSWLKAASAGADVTMSVCTGAFQLGRAGLLRGIPATTHHDFFDSFTKEFPTVELRRGLRFVDSGRIATAGGLTSGIDMALHIVQRYFGADVAATTARYLEHSSEAWRDGVI